jgi:CO dehydrogenase nickel-insertion accessory protein CooC1
LGMNIFAPTSICFLTNICKEPLSRRNTLTEGYIVNDSEKGVEHTGGRKYELSSLK